MSHWKSRSHKWWVIGNAFRETHLKIFVEPLHKQNFINLLGWFFQMWASIINSWICFFLGRYPTHNFLNTRFRVDISFKGRYHVNFTCIFGFQETLALLPSSQCYKTNPEGGGHAVGWVCIKDNPTSCRLEFRQQMTVFSEFTFVPECMSIPKWSN